jgi:hypothetical protein
MPAMQSTAATLLDELVAQIATKWQQIGNSFEPSTVESSKKPYTRE